MNPDYHISCRAIIKNHGKRLVLESSTLTLASERLRLEDRRLHADPGVTPGGEIALEKIRRDHAG